VGDVMVDVNVGGGAGHGAEVVVAEGGSAANAAVWAASLGAWATVVGRVGADAGARMLRTGLDERGVRTLLATDPALPTGAVVTLDGSPRVDRGANRAFTPGDVPGRLAFDAVLVSGYALLQVDSGPAAEAALARAVTGWLAVDAGSAGLLEQYGAERFLEATQAADVLLANEEEARILTGEEPEAAAATLGRHFRLACVKRGAAGAVAVLDGTSMSAPAPPVLDPRPNGAGDAFAPGLLCALARGASLGDALVEACRCGSLAASRDEAWPP